MLHPVGDLGPSVYWRRRIFLLAALALAAVSAYALVFHTGSGGKRTAAGTTSSPPASTASNSVAVTSSSAPPRTSARPSQTPVSNVQAVPTACTPQQLTIRAATDAPAYPVGAKPLVSLVVINNGPAPCVADLADPQIELRVFSGSARVWGSHDCAVEPGSSPQTLPVGQPIRREVSWSGLSSQVGCTGVRQRVPAGNYTLFALLGGTQGVPASFSFTG
jgi:hypothetical protein